MPEVVEPLLAYLRVPEHLLEVVRDIGVIEQRAMVVIKTRSRSCQRDPTCSRSASL
ncbi:MAG: hypothetical protein M3Z24_00210 [Chloroflexota bacterium]|nr:hypothetical protein [Chloroflexota bacterium]